MHVYFDSLYLCQECKYQLHPHLLLDYIVDLEWLALDLVYLNAMVHLIEFQLQLQMSPLREALHYLDVLSKDCKSDEL